MRADVALRMASLDQISPEIIPKIAAVIGQKLKALGEFSRESYGGVRAVAEMFNRLDSDIQQGNPGPHRAAGHQPGRNHPPPDVRLRRPAADRSRSASRKSSPRSIARSSPSRSRAPANSCRNHFLSCMSQRGADMLREDMEALGPVKIKEVEAAQQQIIALVRQLESEGVLSLKGSRRRTVCRLRSFRPAATRRSCPSPGAASSSAEAALSTANQPVARPTPARLAQLEQQAEQKARDAYAAGLREGEAAGRTRAAGDLQPVIERLARAIDEIADLRAAPARAKPKPTWSACSLAIARRVLRRELAIDPEALHGLVLGALEKLAGPGNHARPRPSRPRRRWSTACLRQNGAAANVEVVPDPAREPRRRRLRNRSAATSTPPSNRSSRKSSAALPTACGDNHDHRIARALLRRTRTRRPDALDRRGHRGRRPADRIARTQRRHRRFLRDPDLRRPRDPHPGDRLPRRPRALHAARGDRRPAARRPDRGAQRGRPRRSRARAARPRARRLRQAHGRRSADRSRAMPTSLYGTPASPLDREHITEPLVTGIRAIDGLLPCGKGQRIGIFGGSGVGKSTLLGCHVAPQLRRRQRDRADRRAQPRSARVSRTRTGPGGHASAPWWSCATSDRPAPLRVRACFVALAIAEYFRDQGANVLLVMDSVTRLAMAQREIGLAAGEPPSQKGYTPSVFNLLPKIFERAGNFASGSITGFFTVLVEGDDFNEPICDAVRAILDGHIILSRQLGRAGPLSGHRHSALRQPAAPAPSPAPRKRRPPAKSATPWRPTATPKT